MNSGNTTIRNNQFNLKIDKRSGKTPNPKIYNMANSMQKETSFSSGD
jgi:hypothetical protein